MAEISDLRRATRVRGRLSPSVELSIAINRYLCELPQTDIRVYTAAEALLHDDQLPEELEIRLAPVREVAASLAQTAFVLAGGPVRQQLYKNGKGRFMFEVRNSQGLNGFADALAEIDDIEKSNNNLLYVDVARGALSRDLRLRRKHFYAGHREFTRETHREDTGRRIAAHELQLDYLSGMYLQTRSDSLHNE